MRELKVLEQRFEARETKDTIPNFDIEWEYSGKTVSLQLLFEKEVENIAFEYFGDKLERQSDGKLLLKTEMPDGHWLYGFILSFGTEVEVIKPPYLRQVIADLSKKIYKKYTSEEP